MIHSVVAGIFVGAFRCRIGPLVPKSRGAERDAYEAVYTDSVPFSRTAVQAGQLAAFRGALDAQGE
jgi:hypothetical protein